MVRSPVTGLVFSALVILDLIAIYTGWLPAQLLAIGLVLVVPILNWRQLRLREAYLLAISFSLAIIAFSGLVTDFEQAQSWVFDALSRSAYLASFILLMALLREGALTSNSVLQIGRFLTRQPPSRRFFAIFSGSHFLAVMINLGALSLLAPIIQRGVRADLEPNQPLDEISQIRERRQLSASLRGFSWFLVWAPTAVTQAVMPTLMTGINPFKLIGLGLVLALLMSLVSWTEDWIRWRSYALNRQRTNPSATLQTLPLPKTAFRNFLLVCALLFSSSVLFSQWGEVSIVSGVMLASPLVVFIWVVIQQDSKTRSNHAYRRFDQILIEAMPGYIRELVFIACAGFIGTLAAKLIPIAELANAAGVDNAHGWLVLWGLTVVVWIFGQVGLSPITMAVFLGSAIAELPVLPVDMTHAALAIAAGTAVCSTGAPFSAGALMLARATGHTAFTLTWRWNGTYTIAAMAVLSVVYMGLEGF